MVNANTPNRSIFRDCFSSALLERLARTPSKATRERRPKNRKHRHMDTKLEASGATQESCGTDTDDLADFIDYLASEIFSTLPADLQTLSYALTQTNPRLGQMYTEASIPSLTESLLPLLPSTVDESLASYAVLPPGTSFPPLLASTLTDYIVTITAPPLAWSSTRTSACEICERDWIPLTYHHLIPKQMHEKAVKRGWHEPWRLNSVAWLCRACHSFVHRIAGNEELAREYWSVELLTVRADVQKWARWVGAVRWKAK